MRSDTVYLFTRNGLGHGPQELQSALAKKFLLLTLETGQLPRRILFYTDAVKLACSDSNVLDELRALEAQGVELILCQTCLNTYNLLDQVQVGIVGGMGDIIETLQQAPRVVSL